ncbi:MAG: four helix bundle protein [Ignavibacteriales bacterium]|nr:four helix bundle protein [Ignavibacteriales bacterium]
MGQTLEKAALWQKAQRFVLGVYSLTEQFPASEANGLTPRLRKAAVLVAVNIAEGLSSEEGNNKQQAHFFGISHNLMNECRHYCMFAKYLGYGYSPELTEQLEELDALLRLYSSATVAL